MKNPSVINRLQPELKLALIALKKIQFSENQKLAAEISKEISNIQSCLNHPLAKNIEYNRSLYKFFKIDPTRYRPSSEKLWRRIKRNEPFPQIFPLLDLINLLSLKWQILYGLYSLEKITPPVIACLGEENDSYFSVGNSLINLKGKIILKDRSGPFGNPTCDSRRAAVDENSTSFLVAIYGWHELADFQFYTQETINKITGFFSFKEIDLWE